MQKPPSSANGPGSDTGNGDVERRFRALADALPHIVWTAEPDGSIDFVSQRSETYTGHDFAQVQGWNSRSTIYPDIRQRMIEGRESELPNGVEYTAEVRIKRQSDGTRRWHVDRASPVKDAEGRVVKWVGTITDLEEHKRALSAADRANRGNIG